MKIHQYRSPDPDTVIRVVTDTGHIALVDGEWKALPPIYHNAAIEAGCECDAETLVKNRVKPAASPNAVKDRTADEKIEQALKTMLERDQKDDFNDNGEPNLKVVTKLAGFKVARAQVQPIYERLQEEADAGDDGANA